MLKGTDTTIEDLASHPLLLAGGWNVADETDCGVVGGLIRLNKDAVVRHAVTNEPLEAPEDKWLLVEGDGHEAVEIMFDGVEGFFNDRLIVRPVGDNEHILSFGHHAPDHGWGIVKVVLMPAKDPIYA